MEVNTSQIRVASRAGFMLLVKLEKRVWKDIVCEKTFINFKRLSNVIKSSDLLQGEQCHLGNLDLRLVFCPQTSGINTFKSLLRLQSSSIQ